MKTQWGIRGRGDRIVAVMWAVTAIAFIAIGLWAVATLGLTELYADQWRFYLTYLEKPFWSSLMLADNGHRSAFPVLIRLAEIRFFEGNQQLQLWSGAALAMSTWLAVVFAAWREPDVSLSARWAVAALAAFALFWLGNARMLLHGNETDTVYFITMSLVSALLLVLSPRARAIHYVGACILAFIATFSFGPGLAVFAALIVVSIVRGRYRDAGVFSVVLMLTFVLYLVLPGGDGVRNSLGVRPFENAHVAATWLSSMWVHLFAPLIDTAAGGALPGGVRQIAQQAAAGYASMFGSVESNWLPASVLGWSGVLGLLWMTWRSWRRRERSRLRLLVLGIAWFALGVAGIVSLGRLDYFHAHPGQVFANRYVPWSCLFWLGVLTASLSGFQGRGRSDRTTNVSIMLVIAGVIALGFLTTRGHMIWSELVQQGLRLDSTAFVSGVIDADRELGESLPEEVERGLAPVREAQIAAFAWPEARRIGQTVRADRDEPGVEVMEFEAAPARNRLTGEAIKLRVRFRRLADIDMPLRLIVAVDGVAVGVLVRQTTLAGWSYAGYARTAPSSNGVTLLRLRKKSGAECWFGCVDAGS